MKIQKNETLSLSLKIKSSYADSLSASLTTEAFFENKDGIIIIKESADSFVDLRARWNTIMRGLIASEQVLETVEKERWFSIEEKNTAELQKIVQELQIIRGQIQTFSSQISEYSLTMDSLKSQSPEKTVYKSVGNLLLEVSDRNELYEELSQSKLNIENHLKLLIEKEDSLREKYEELVVAFESQW